MIVNVGSSGICFSMPGSGSCAARYIQFSSLTTVRSAIAMGMCLCSVSKRLTSRTASREADNWLDHRCYSLGADEQRDDEHLFIVSRQPSIPLGSLYS